MYKCKKFLHEGREYADGEKNKTKTFYTLSL